MFVRGNLEGFSRYCCGCLQAVDPGLTLVSPLLPLTYITVE